MKVGFIQAFNPTAFEEDPQPYLAFGFLTSYVRKHLGSVDFFVTDDPEKLTEAKPDVVGISSYSPYFHRAQKIAKEVKGRLGVPVILGGHHVTAIPRALSEEFDIGVLGEGEETLRELLELYLKEGSFQADSLEKVRGIVFRRNGEKIVTPMRELLDPLDRIPPPERGILDWGKGLYYVLTSRGCPYKCVFCSPTTHWGKYRAFSPEFVIDEVIRAKEEYGQEVIIFYDDLLIADLKRFRKIFNVLRDRGIDRGLSFAFSARANLVTEELIEILKEIHVLFIAMGMESGSDRILKYLKSGPISIEDNQRACDLCRRIGVKIQPSFIVLSPPEEREDLVKTFDFIFRNKDVLCRVKTVPLFPLPGTEVWRYATEKGFVSDDMDWRLLEQGMMNLNEKINKYEFYRFIQEFNLLVKKYEIDDDYASELLFPLRAYILGVDDFKPPQARPRPDP